MWDAGTCLRLLFRYVHVVKKSTFHLGHVHPSIHLFTHISIVSSGYIFVKFYKGAFFNICEDKWNLINIVQKYCCSGSSLWFWTCHYIIPPPWSWFYPTIIRILWLTVYVGILVYYCSLQHHWWDLKVTKLYDIGSHITLTVEKALNHHKT